MWRKCTLGNRQGEMDTGLPRNSNAAGRFFSCRPWPSLCVLSHHTRSCICFVSKSQLPVCSSNQQLLFSRLSEQLDHLARLMSSSCGDTPSADGERPTKKVKFRLVQDQHGQSTCKAWEVLSTGPLRVLFCPPAVPAQTARRCPYRSSWLSQPRTQSRSMPCTAPQRLSWRQKCGRGVRPSSASSSTRCVQKAGCLLQPGMFLHSSRWLHQHTARSCALPAVLAAGVW
jgi:hypothetical protein